MSLCFLVSYLLRIVVHAHQLGYAADPHRINAGDVHQFGRDLGAAPPGREPHRGANERRAGEARVMQTRLP